MNSFHENIENSCENIGNFMNLHLHPRDFLCFSGLTPWSFDPKRRVEVPDASSGKRPTAAPEAQHQPHVLVQPLKVDHFVENGHVVYGC